VSGTANGLIAVSPVSSRVVWVSGRGGTYAVTTDGGNSWRAGVVPGAETLQFRDVEGVSDKIAYLMSIGTGTDSRVYKTVDGGATWSLQFMNEDPAGFYDCFAFWTSKRGILFGDSVNGRFPVRARPTAGRGSTSATTCRPPLPGEGGFASSGTCVATQGEKRAWIATGAGERARILTTRDGGDSWAAHDTPLRGSPPPESSAWSSATAPTASSAAATSICRAALRQRGALGRWRKDLAYYGTGADWARFTVWRTRVSAVTTTKTIARRGKAPRGEGGGHGPRWLGVDLQ